jgi:fructosamine-3-kinase
MCKYYDFCEGVPEPVSFCEKLARLHSAPSPDGKFGYPCTTYYGNMPQDNTPSDTWTEFFGRSLRHVLMLRDASAGPSPELEALIPALFDHVIPRLLRPLETNGRQLVPSLLHGDLWSQNTGIIDERTEEGIVFDSSSFWGHNECRSNNPCDVPPSSHAQGQHSH